MNKEQEAKEKSFRDSASSADLEVQEKMTLLQWFGCSLEFVTNKSHGGSQFCRGLDRIGGILRYQLDMRTFDEFSENTNLPHLR